MSLLMGTRPVKARVRQPGSRRLAPSSSLSRKVLWSPIPGQEFVDALCGVVWQSSEDIGEPGARVDAVELGGLDQGVDGGGTASAFVGHGEGPVVAANRNLSVILPISGRRWKSIIGGTRSLGVVSGFSAASNVVLAALPTSGRRPAW
jgi:hypothetical protein